MREAGCTSAPPVGSAHIPVSTHPTTVVNAWTAAPSRFATSPCGNLPASSNARMLPVLVVRTLRPLVPFEEVTISYADLPVGACVRAQDEEENGSESDHGGGGAKPSGGGAAKEPKGGSGLAKGGGAAMAVDEPVAANAVASTRAEKTSTGPPGGGGKGKQKDGGATSRPEHREKVRRGTYRDTVQLLKQMLQPKSPRICLCGSTGCVGVFMSEELHG